MRLHRFYINQIVGAQDEFTINSSELVNQIHSVFRLKSGDEVILFDGTGFDYVCRIEDFDKKSMTFAVVSTVRSRYMSKRRVSLYASIVKKDNFEWIVQKATELGISEIVPVISERSEKKNLNQERLTKISVEASEQCGRGDVPTIKDIVSLKDVVKVLSENKELQKIVFHTECNLHIDDLLNDMDPDSALAVFIGPEGGWSQDEVDMFTENNFSIVELGKQVLRAETAVISALSKVLL